MVVRWFGRVSSKHTIVDSTTEVEYIATLEASKEAFWIKMFLEEIGVVPSVMNPMVLYCDNSGAAAQAKEPRSLENQTH